MFHCVAFCRELNLLRGDIEMTGLADVQYFCGTVNLSKAPSATSPPVLSFLGGWHGWMCH